MDQMVAFASSTNNKPPVVFTTSDIIEEAHECHRLLTNEMHDIKIGILTDNVNNETLSKKQIANPDPPVVEDSTLTMNLTNGTYQYHDLTQIQQYEVFEFNGQAEGEGDHSFDNNVRYVYQLVSIDISKEFISQINDIRREK